MKYLLLIFLLVAQHYLHAGTIVVTSTNNAGNGSLREACANSISGDTVRFDPSLIVSGNDTIELDSSIVLDRGLVVIGLFNSSDTLFISGGMVSGVFQFDLYDDNFGMLVLDSLCVVNAASDTFGGAILVVDADSVRVSNSYFSNCNSSFDGGVLAIKLFKNEETVLVINRSGFIGNSSTVGGGVIFMPYGETYIKSSKFIANRATGSGGVISAHGGEINIEDCNFTRNTAELSGGVIRGTNVDLTIENSEFKENIAITGGGAIYANNAEFLSCILKQNVSVNGSGGAVAVKKSLKFENCLIKDNQAKASGGAAVNFCTEPSTTIVAYCEITNNSSANGGALHTYNLQITNSRVDSNYAVEDGGAIYACNKAVITKCGFTMNSCQEHGGAVFSSEKLEIYDSKIEVNRALKGGGVYADDLIITDSKLEKNSCSSDGGALYIRGFSTIEDCIFNKDSASNDGGAIFSEWYIYPLRVEFKNNIAGNSGGACKTVRNVNPVQSLFDKNKALQGKGGAIHCNSVYADSCVFTENSAHLEGGAISSQYAIASTANVELRFSTLHNNQSKTESGGAVKVNGSTDANVLIYQSNLYGNQALNGNGGAIECTSWSSEAAIKISYSTISDNEARYGGGAYAQSNFKNEKINVDHSTIAYNKASSTGGGLVAQDLVTMENSTIVGNFAVSHSGAYTSSQPITTSNIIAFNSGTLSKIISGGYNIFQGNALSGGLSTDRWNADSSKLKLGPLQYNGGYTLTMLPQEGSIAIDSGKTSDTTRAQNRAIVGVRDVGAAEYNCLVRDTVEFLGCDSFNFKGVEFYEPFIVSEYLESNANCDSVIVINVKINKSTSAPKQTIASCDSAQINGMWYVQSTLVFDTFSTNSGCDSIVPIEIIISSIDMNINVENQTLISTQENADVYQWLDCLNSYNEISGATSQTYTPDSTGQFAVKISKDECADTSDCVLFTKLGLDYIARSNFLLYPNPVQDWLHIVTDRPGKALLKLHDQFGREIQVNFIVSTSIVDVDLSALPPSIYYLTLKYSDYTVQRAILKY